MKKTFVFIAALMIAAPAMASVSLTWTVTPNAAPGLDKIVGNLTTTSGNIDAIDCGVTESPGLTGSFYQDWVGGASKTPSATYETIAVYPSPDIDTHFLFAEAMMTFDGAYAPDEDNDMSAGDGCGYGTYLSGTFGLNPDVQSMDMDFVQLYVPTGTASSVSYYLEVSEAGNPKGVFEGTVPEPTTMVLLGLGGLALLRRRRK